MSSDNQGFSIFGGHIPQDAPVQDAPTQGAPAQDATAQDATAQDATAQDATAQDASLQNAPVAYRFHILIPQSEAKSSEDRATKTEDDTNANSKPISLKTLLEPGNFRHRMKDTSMDSLSDIPGMIAEVDYKHDGRSRGFTSTFDTPFIIGKLLPDNANTKNNFTTGATVQVITDHSVEWSNLPCGRATFHLTELSAGGLDVPLYYTCDSDAKKKPQFRPMTPGPVMESSAATTDGYDLTTLGNGTLVISNLKGRLTWDDGSQENVPCRMYITKHNPHRVQTQKSDKTSVDKSV